MGFTDRLLPWLRKSPGSKMFHTKVKTTHTSRKVSTSGVSQTVILGSLLLSIFINDMLDEINSVGLIYTDNAKIWRFIESEKDSAELQNKLGKINEWGIDDESTINQ